MNTDSSQQNLPSNSNTTLSLWYQNIHELPFYKFKEIDITGNIKLLIITGSPSDADLLHAWQIIRMQFSDAMGEELHVHYSNVYKELALLSADYQVIQTIIPVIAQANKLEIYVPQLYKELNSFLHSAIPFYENDFEANEENVKKANSRSKAIKMRIDMLTNEFEALQLKEETKKPTEAYYQSILISLSDHAGYNVTDHITTYEFCERVRRMNVYIKELKKKHGRK